MIKEQRDATKQGELEKVRSLQENGADINSKDEHGQTALMNAAHAGQIELVRLLIEEGAKLDTTAKYHLYALMLALITHHVDVAKLLIEAGADVNIRSSTDFYGRSALFLAKLVLTVKLSRCSNKKERPLEHMAFHAEFR